MFFSVCLFEIHMSNIYVCHGVCSSGWLAVLHGKIFNIGHNTQTFNSISWDSLDNSMS